MKNLLATLTLALALVGCRSGPEPQWVEERLEVRTERNLFEVLRLALDQADYAVGSEGNRPDERRIVTAWKMDLSPFKGRGFRQKAHVEYSPIPPAEDELMQREWNVRVRVETQTNESFRGIDLRYADWKAAPDDESAARFIVQNARSLLGGRDFELREEPPRIIE